MDPAEKVRENRLRRAAKRQGLELVKSRRRDPRAISYGTYGLVDPDRDAWVFCDVKNGFGLDLDAVEEWLMIGTHAPRDETETTALPLEARLRRKWSIDLA